MSDIRNDDEQLEALKNWWKDNGQQIITTVIVVAAGYFGWNFWQNHKAEQIYAANDIYMQLVLAVEQSEVGGIALDEELQTISYLTDQLQSDYANSQYAFLGSLIAARTAVQEGDLDQAKARLEWALANADTPAESQLASYRLAKVEQARGELDVALAILNGEADEFRSLYADLRGDILLAQGDREGALAAYRVASENLLPAQQHYQSTLRLKIDNLTHGLGSL